MDLGQSRSNLSGLNGAKANSQDPQQLEQIAAKLSQEIAYLQSAKEQLENEVDSLKEQYRSLQQVVQASEERRNPPPEAKPIPLSMPAAPLPLPASATKLSQLQQGLWLVLISTIALSIHNVVVRIILGAPSNLFGLFSFGGFIQPSLGNSLLILWTRMLVVVPLMLLGAGVLYPPVWRDIRRLLTDRDRKPLWNVIGSGVFLFLSQVLIYIAIAQIGPGAAVTILFMYPLVTLPLAWWLFGDRPTVLRLGVMLIILLGVIFTAMPNLVRTSSVSAGGVVVAALAGVAFAFYLIFMQLGFKKLHPVPVSLVQFVTILFLSSLSLALPLQLGVAIPPQNRMELLVGGLVLGALTLAGYLTNNFGVRYMGAARASILASSGPVLTAVLAAIILQSQLAQIQVVGILLVTIGVTALSFERMKQMKAAAKS